MPIYEYQCKDCGDRIEEMQKMSDPRLTTCKECGGELKKLVSAPAVQFKGEGWYVTDYADKGKKKDAEKGKSESGEGKSETKSESKSETKSEPKSDGGSKSDAKKTGSAATE